MSNAVWWGASAGLGEWGEGKAVGKWEWWKLRKIHGLLAKHIYCIERLELNIVSSVALDMAATPAFRDIP